MSVVKLENPVFAAQQLYLINDSGIPRKPDVTQSFCVSSEDDLLSNEIGAPSDFGGIESPV